MQGCSVTLMTLLVQGNAIYCRKPLKSHQKIILYCQYEPMLIVRINFKTMW